MRPLQKNLMGRKGVQSIKKKQSWRESGSGNSRNNNNRSIICYGRDVAFSRIRAERKQLSPLFPFVIPAFVSCKRSDGHRGRHGLLHAYGRTKSLPFLFLNYIYVAQDRASNREYSISCLRVGIFFIARRKENRGFRSFQREEIFFFLSFFSSLPRIE